MHKVTGKQGGVVRILAALALAGLHTAPLCAQSQPPPSEEPIITDQEFEAAVPPVTAEDDPELGRSLESIDEFERKLTPQGEAAPAPSPVGQDAELATPLPPLETFRAEPVVFSGAAVAPQDAEIVYRVDLNGLGEVVAASERDLLGEFFRLSLLRTKGKARNTTQISSRAGEDVLLLKKLLAADGWFDAQVRTRIDRPADQGPLVVALDVMPGKRFAFSTISVTAAPTLPPDLISRNLELATGQPVIAERVLAAEAKVALALPENGYPFAELGTRDVLLDQDTGAAAYTLPVTVGPRGTYGAIRSEGNEAFGADHVQTLARFKAGELYDSRMVDDLRQALIATGLFRAIAVEPTRTGEAGPGGTEQVDLVVKQEAGPPRVIAATAGYGTGEGFRVEASWTHRNLFQPEGALIVSGLVGTLEQSAGVTFRRSNAGRRDRTFELASELHHASTEAYSAYTGRLAARISYDSTPIWQKRLTYAYGAQLIGTDESVFDPRLRIRQRRTYAIAGLTGQVGWDMTDSLLDPTRGFRLTALVEPEGALRGGFTPYARVRLDGSAYYRVAENIVLAGRVRAATIQGAELDRIAPSRRIYAGGGGSVRGFAYQQLGPRDINNDPTGGRSLNEAAFEVRYRFGDYGVVGFVDVGQSYAKALPDFSDLRVGVGLGARIYTNFGPMRLDVATPLRRRPGESRINVYVSIGQAF
ncbi:MAG: hypothetical protein EBR34_06680 [Sphingomonadaceae bacterium]|nr:hypothetical protein [Sphingomonadaceae bacterium]